MSDNNMKHHKDTGEKRKETTIAKLERMRKTLQHQEPDRSPMSDFFWGSFVKRWQKDLGLSHDADPYYYYDLDWTGFALPFK